VPVTFTFHSCVSGFNPNALCDTDNLIRSFVTEIYIAPLRGYYSEALPTLARLKKTVFRLVVECVGKNPGDQSLCQWKPIPHKGPTTKNARAWLVDVWAKGTKSNVLRSIE